MARKRPSGFRAECGAGLRIGGAGRTARRVSTGLALVAGLACSPAEAGVVRDHGALRVEGNRIVDASGAPLQIAGMSLFWPQWSGAAFYTREAVNTLVNDWGSSVVRAPMPVYTPNSNPNFQYDAKYVADVKRVVQAAIDADIYVIVDWHLEGDQPHPELAKPFFEDMARTFGKSPNVIWEVWNEPIHADWGTIRSYAKDILGAIRPYSSNLAIVGSGTWSTKISDPMANPVDDRNVAYTWHFYACDSDQKGRDWVATASRKIPIFITEWGTTKANGTDAYCPDESDKWMAMAHDNGISWTAWSFSNQGGLTAALKGWGLYDLTTNGTYLKAKIQEVAADLRRQRVLDTTALPGRIVAVDFATSSAGLRAETTTDEGGGQDLGYSADGSWAEYTAKVARTGLYELRARVATANSGRLAFSWKGKPLGAIDVGNTGGWQSWETKTLEVRLEDAGVGAFRVAWSGTSQGLVNLNWIDLVAKSSGVGRSVPDPAFRAVPTSSGIVLEYPTGTRRVVVAGLDGAVLARKDLAGTVSTTLDVSAAGLVVARFEGARGTVVRTLLRRPR